MPADSPPDVEETPIPAVSSLRSKFEKLAIDSSPNASLHKTASGHDLLVPEPSSPRPRAMSNHDQRSASPVDPRALRTAASSSDLKSGVNAKRPPPPPPPPRSRGSSPAASVRASPLMQAVADSPAASIPPVNITPSDASPSKAALLARRPPPPPASVQHDPFDDHPVGGVAARISMFGNLASPNTSPTKAPYSVGRVASHSSVPTPSTSTGAQTLSAARPPRPPRHSFPISPPLNPVTSHAAVSSPFEGDTDTESSTSRLPPPLPCRRPNMNGRTDDGDHGRSGSSESIGSTSSESGTHASASQSSLATAESTSTIPRASPSTRPPIPPPRPPPRPKSVRPVSVNVSASPSPSSGTPPPLPARKASVQIDDPHGRRPPPPRHHTMMDGDSQPYHPPSHIMTSALPQLSTSPAAMTPIEPSPPASAPSTVPLAERKTFGAHLPPPTRTIALGDKLPPARRPPSGSSSESEEEDTKVKVEQLPDFTRASRRPPTISCHDHSELQIHVPAYTGIVAASGHIVAVGHHHLKIYDLSQSDNPIHDLDARGIGLETKAKDFKITSLQFRPATDPSERGCYLWIGTKDGHLIELDIRGPLVVGLRLAVHTHSVTHIFRYARSMVSVDETGKALVFTPSQAPGSSPDPGLASTQPRVVRISEKQEFVKMLGGYLWTSTRDVNNTGAGNTSRSPIVRVYDVFNPGSVGKSILPTEHLGAVTSGTMIPTQKDLVYLGHEGGNVSIWTLDTEDGVPACQEIIKISTSDILCLQGVNDRLWAGGRKGMIAAYDVVPRPWVMTNNWMAHQRLPVLQLVIDTSSIEKLERLQVYSIGRDERLRFWDGLLGTSWVDQELLKRESEYSTFRDLKVLIVSWNMDSAKPDYLNGNPENINFLRDALTSVDSPDIIAFGFQELIDLESRRMAAKTVLLGGKGKNTDGAISQKVTTAYKKWYDRLVLAVRLTMPPDTPYTVIHTENLVGLFTCIFVKETHRTSLKQIAITTIKRGMGGRYGNKGGIVARFVIDDSSICFINCHLAAGQSHVRQRNADVAAILEDKELFPESDPSQAIAYVNGGDGTMVLDHELVFLNGDMNYRIDMRRDAVISDIRSGNLTRLLAQDQLLKEMKNNRGFRLRTFIEGPLTFAPTYKYDRRSNEYDSSEKRRVPAWCDRILWKSREPDRVEQLHYRRYEADVSDHRPISAGFRMTIKSVSEEPRALVKAELEGAWAVHEKSLLAAAHQFFVDQAMV